MRLFFFTMHRSGSMVLHRTLLHAAGKLNVPLISPNAGGQRIPLRQLAQQKDSFRFPEAFICGALRGYIPFPALSSAKVMLHVRDPRDVLTSMFFSYCYSHTGQEAGDTGHRHEIAERGIDWFVLHLSESETLDLAGDYGTGAQLTDLIGAVPQRYRDYLALLQSRPDAVLLKYEDMMARPDVWLAAVNGVLGLADLAEIEALIGADQPAAEPTEDKWAHRRQATPGDFERKLKPETIRRLDEIYAPALEGFGYA